MKAPLSSSNINGRMKPRPFRRSTASCEGKPTPRYREALKCARDDQATARTDSGRSINIFHDVSWNTSGQTARLLSLVAVIESLHRRRAPQP